MIQTLFVSLAVFISTSVGAERGPHFDLEMTIDEYQTAYRRHFTSQLKNGISPQDITQPNPHDIESIIRRGEKNLEWLRLINENRSEKISLTAPGQSVGIPINRPKKYSDKTISERSEKIALKIPEPMKKVLYGEAPLSADLPLSPEQFVKFSRAVIGVYQTALRWELYQPHLDWLRGRQMFDVRGYYFLSRTENIRELLKNWNTLDHSEVQRLQPWLIGICMNSRLPFMACKTVLDSKIAASDVEIFYLQYIGPAKRHFESFFQVRNPRPELVWSEGLAKLPFLDPQDEKIQSFLKENIEDEFQFKGWKLELDFTPEADVHIVFQPGVTPNVNGLGGNRITMDSNIPITEYVSQWTIRHEFGHVLGLPDCYLEFWDNQEEVIVSYQFDVKNLMCSRAGEFQRTHFDELKKRYLKKALLKGSDSL